MVKKTVYLTVAEGANDANNLTVSATISQVTGGVDVSAVKLIITTSDDGFAAIDSSTGPNVDIKGDNTALTDTTAVRVDIYLYYDGNDSNVYTNNRVNLKGASVSLAFHVDSINE